MRVLKFGGTSIGNAERLRVACDITINQKANIVVLSAMNGSTNKLVSLAKNKNKDELLLLHDSYKKTTYELLKNSINITEALSFIDDQFKELSFLISTVHTNLNEIITKGEIISTQLLSYYMLENEIEHQLLDSREIVRINEFGEPDQFFIKTNLDKKFNPNIINIIQGFICVDYEGNISNLRRGGSDYTASLIAEAINADEIQIWTDIDGFHNNDPRYVENTESISYLTYDEAAELAYFGAKILHPNTLIPAKRANIPVWLKNSMRPEQEGTLIAHETVDSEIKAISAKDGITAIKIKSSRMLLAYGFLRKVFQIFEEYKTPIDMIATSEIAVSLTIDCDDNLDNILKELSHWGEVEVDKNQSIICIVGNMISSEKGKVTNVFNALNHVPIRMVSYGGSQHNISILVDESNKIEALNSLHQNVFTNAPVTAN